MGVEAKALGLRSRKRECAEWQGRLYSLEMSSEEQRREGQSTTGGREARTE